MRSKSVRKPIIQAADEQPVHSFHSFSACLIFSFYLYFWLCCEILIVQWWIPGCGLMFSWSSLVGWLGCNLPVQLYSNSRICITCITDMFCIISAWFFVSGYLLVWASASRRLGVRGGNNCRYAQICICERLKNFASTYVMFFARFTEWILGRRWFLWLAYSGRTLAPLSLILDVLWVGCTSLVRLLFFRGWNSDVFVQDRLFCIIRVLDDQPVRIANTYFLVYVSPSRFVSWVRFGISNYQAFFWVCVLV